MRKAVALAGISIVTAFLGGIVVPNLYTSLNRSRQKRSMADMRSIATALEARASMENSYAITPAAALSTGEEFASLATVSYEELERALTPKYIKKLPSHDGWGNAFEVRISARNYAIRSPGSDDRFNTDSYPPRLTTSFKEDIVLSNGNFIRYPDGVCAQ